MNNWFFKSAVMSMRHIFSCYRILYPNDDTQVNWELFLDELVSEAEKDEN
jgi:hypothetical protein